MEGKHKNALIGALLAVVFVMAVGYAAFAQLLTINGTATINSTWDVHFDPSLTTASAINTNQGETTSATGSIAYTESNTVATLTANLVSPGDEVTFTVKPTNYGSLSAQRQGTVVMTATDGTTVVGPTGQTARSAQGNITWTIVSATNNTLTGSDGATPTSANQDTIVVKASLTGDGAIAEQSSAITIGLNYAQVTS